jgi:hypothetical protein
MLNETAGGIDVQILKFLFQTKLYLFEREKSNQ